MVDDGPTDDGRTPDHGHPISSPCEPNGSGELILNNTTAKTEDIVSIHKQYLSSFE